MNNDALNGAKLSTNSAPSEQSDALNLNFHEGTVNEGIVTCGDCE